MHAKTKINRHAKLVSVSLELRALLSRMVTLTFYTLERKVVEKVGNQISINYGEKDFKRKGRLEIK